MRQRILTRKDGAVFMWSKALATHEDMTAGWLGDGPEPEVGVASPPEPRPAEAQVAVADMPADTIPDGPLTPETLEAMSKKAMAAYALKRYGATLDMRKRAEDIRAQVWELQHASGGNVKAEGSL